MSCFCLQHVQLSGLRSQLGIRSQTSFVFTEFFLQSASLCLSHSLGYSELQFLASILRVCGSVLHSAPAFFRSNKIDVKRVRYICADCVLKTLTKVSIQSHPACFFTVKML